MTPRALAAPASTPTSASSVASTLDDACSSRHPGVLCHIVWDLTHNTTVAQNVHDYLARPVNIGLQIIWVIGLALLVKFAANRLINRIAGRAVHSSQAQAESNGGTVIDRRAQRARALASILRNAASVTIFAIAFMIILSDLGLNLAPVLASAGVVGIAIGFGAQNLVQDFLAGIFMLLEDQYGVGDSVSIGTVSGTIEGVSLRITRLRDVNGVAWHIRNGTIQQSGNQSHGWARAVVDFPVPYDSDVPAITAVIDQAAAAMYSESPWRGVLLDKPEVWGVQEVSVDTVVLRVTARTAPMRQFEVARELRRRLIDAVEVVEAPELVSASRMTRRPQVTTGTTVPAAAVPAAGTGAAAGTAAAGTAAAGAAKTGTPAPGPTSGATAAGTSRAGAGRPLLARPRRKPAARKPSARASAAGQPAEDRPEQDRPPHDQPPHDQPPHDQPPQDQPPQDQPSQDQPSQDEPPEDMPG